MEKQTDVLDGPAMGRTQGEKKGSEGLTGLYGKLHSLVT